MQSIHVNDSDLSIQYATRTPIRDRQGQIEEIPLVWDLLVKDRLKGAVFSEVTLFPEDLSGSSFSITFTKNTSGQWNALAPYRIRIPVDGEPASR